MKKKILAIAGASGVVGRHIIAYALRNNWHIRIITRQYPENYLQKIGRFKKIPPPNITYYIWNFQNDPENDKEAINALNGSDFFINLAGKSIANGRLNKKMQLDVMNSRINCTNALLNVYKKCKYPPGVWGQASAIGYYGETGEDSITENNLPGKLFLSKVCIGWENAARELLKINSSIKLITARIGLVLAKDAPAWQKMIKPVRLGFGGGIGSGSQWFSWIDADDLAAAFFFLYNRKNSGGVYNFTAPQAIRQIELSKKIANFYHKPHFMKIPGFLIRIIMGKSADELLLVSCKALPEKLIEAGFKFKKKKIDDEVNYLLAQND